MKLILTPGKPLRGVITPQQRPSLPGDKSLSHRAALFAALAQGVSQIDNFLVSGVTRAMLDALTALEVPWELQGTTLRVTGKGPRQLCAPAKAISCGNSATTLRLLAGALAAAGIGATLDGSDGLRRRPMGRIVDPLQAMGVAIQASRSGTAPLVLQARPAQQPLRPLHYTLPVASAQVKSCLLLAALAAEGQTTLLEPGPSRDHTERMLKSMGVDIVSQPPSETQPYYQTQLTPSPAMTLSPLHMRLPGDLSAAAFLIALALWVLQDRIAPIAVFGSYLVMSGLSRILVELVRINNPVLLGMTEAQLFGLASIIGGIVLIARARGAGQTDSPEPAPLTTPVA